MTPNQHFTLAALCAQLLSLGASHAAIIASTDFNGRGLTTTNISNDTATTLNWTLDGVADPGNMTAVEENGASFPGLFNGNTLTQNLFAPGINVGNNDTGWKTTVDLTVLPGNIVTLTDVTFLYAAINGSEGLQGAGVPRKSDFTITLFDPSAVFVDDVFIDDTLGDPTPVSAVFDSPIALTAPGTYTLEIHGREAPETGNHIGIDDLSINGTVAPVPEPSSLALTAFGLLAAVGYRRRAG